MVASVVVASVVVASVVMGLVVVTSAAVVVASIVVVISVTMDSTVDGVMAVTPVVVMSNMPSPELVVISAAVVVMVW